MIIIATTKRLKNPPKTHERVVEVIRYILNPDKTADEKCLYVNSINCSVANTANEFKAVRKQWQKHSGNYAYHFEQSFKPGETTPEECHQCGFELAEVLFAKYGYQVIFATHLDKKHLHNHFVVNAVNPVDGKKLQTDHEFIRRMRAENDRICKAHNLSVISEPKGKGKSYGEWITDKNGGFTWRGMIRDDIDDLIGSVNSIKELFDKLTSLGYEINSEGKYIKLSPTGTKTFFRLHKLGKGYSLEELSERIIKQSFPYYNPQTNKSSPYTIAPLIIVRYKFNGTFSNLRKHKGFQGMYLYYLIKLRKFLNSSSAYKKRMPAQMRKDSTVVNEFAEDLRILSDNHITNIEELTAFFSNCNGELKSCYEKRNFLNEKLVECNNTKELKIIHQEVENVKGNISQLKSKIRSAERIFKRTETVNQTIQQINNIQKGRKDDVSRIRSNRYSGENINGRS